MPEQDFIADYAEELQRQFATGHAREHAYRPALERLMSSFEDVTAVNDPKRSQYGNPDFVFVKRSNKDLSIGYAEAKDITVDLAKTAETEQLKRYAGYEKLFLTNYLDFIFYKNGEQYESITIGKIHGTRLLFDVDEFHRLQNELGAFLDRKPEAIRSGKRLAIIMGGKAQRIRDNVRQYLEHVGNEKNIELEKIFGLMKKLLIHDLDESKFADMYAQTLVYGLFAARYNDNSPDSFDRREAVELVPRSNPFLRQFFDHIAGKDFDPRLAHIVDELCDVFSVSDVNTLVHKHLRLFEVEDEKDPIIHFYEDFLKEYDPAERKKMGAYYTPVPVVKFIIRQVDGILKDDFGLRKGLADTSKILHDVDVGQDMRHDRRQKLTTIQRKEFHRVQILDPAVGTATFLNEAVKHIHQDFSNQAGQWSSYVNEHLLPRLHGFELMVAPYTVAHLKLGITLKETGVKDLEDRLGIYLTNTLEEGIPRQQDLFSIGLAAAVTEESEKANEIKHERPIMVVVGNPPYSVSSNNKSGYIQDLIKDYKKDLNERKINLDDDYIKFIRFAEEMIAKNQSGIVAMITNNSYIDGITHRQMRKHLLQTFDKIYVLDLHGNSKKKEAAPDGGKDENVFDIMQGVSIVLMVKLEGEQSAELGAVYHAEMYGKRSTKFDRLNANTTKFSKIEAAAPLYFFVPKDNSLSDEYEEGTSINDLMINKASGFRSGDDSTQVCWTKEQIAKVVGDLIDMSEDDYRSKYNLKDGRNHYYQGMKKDVGAEVDAGRIIATLYRPFDIRWTYYSAKSSSFVARPRNLTMKHFVKHKNIGLIYKRGYTEEQSAPVGVTDLVSHERTWSRAGMQGADTVAPLYLYHDDGTCSPNFNHNLVLQLIEGLSFKEGNEKISLKYSEECKERDYRKAEPYFTKENVYPSDLFNYIYAALHSPSYRSKYKELINVDFPRVPKPKSGKEFWRLAKLGNELRNLHLMRSPDIDDYTTRYPITGSNEVEKIQYKDNKVYINSTQYFGNVPIMAWELYIGGYQPAQKWLKDRKGRKLTSDDIIHYQRIVRIILEANKLANKIDKTDS